MAPQENAVRVLQSIGLKPNASDPCMFPGSIWDPNNPAADIPAAPLQIGLYVDDFVYFSEDPKVEQRFEQLLSSLVTVNFLGTVDWFLGTHFQWSWHDDEVWVHLSQFGFAAYLVEDNNVHTRNITPDATPYRSGLPIDVCPESDEADDCPALLKRNKRDTKVWLVRSVGWLKAQGPTSPDPTPSCRRTISNHPKATGMRHSTSYTTFIQRPTTDLHSPPSHKFLSTGSCRSLHHLTQKHTPTPSHLRLLNIIVSPLIATPAGDPNLATQSAKAFNSQASNFGV